MSTRRLGAGGNFIDPAKGKGWKIVRVAKDAGGMTAVILAGGRILPKP
jgi:hypothetical protein